MHHLLSATRTVKLAFFTVAVASLVSIGPASAQPNIYAQADLALLKRSAIPVLLPTLFPSRVQSSQLTPSVLNAGPAGYTIVWSADPQCFGASACTSFFMTGAKTSTEKPHGKLVSGGVAESSYFYPKTCEARCTDEIFTLTRGNAQYVLSGRLSLGRARFVQLVQSLKPVSAIFAGR